MHYLLRSLASALTLILCATPAAAITKCVNNGNVTYTDLDCEQDAIAEPFTRPVAPPDDPVAARQRYLSDQKQLQQIELENDRLEKTRQNAMHIAARQANLAKAKQYRCKQLDTQRKVAQLRQSEIKHSMTKNHAEQAQLLAQQAQTNYTELCSEN